MKKAVIQITFDTQKDRALRKYMKEKNTDPETEMTIYMDKLYSKHVPAAVREFIEEECKLQIKDQVVGRQKNRQYRCTLTNYKEKSCQRFLGDVCRIEDLRHKQPYKAKNTACEDVQSA